MVPDAVMRCGWFPPGNRGRVTRTFQSSERVAGHPAHHSGLPAIGRHREMTGTRLPAGPPALRQLPQGAQLRPDIGSERSKNFSTRSDSYRKARSFAATSAASEAASSIVLPWPMPGRTCPTWVSHVSFWVR